MTTQSGLYKMTILTGLFYMHATGSIFNPEKRIEAHDLVIIVTRDTHKEALDYLISQGNKYQAEFNKSFSGHPVFIQYFSGALTLEECQARVSDARAIVVDRDIKPTAPVKVAPVKVAPVKVAPVKVAPVKVAPVVFIGTFYNVLKKKNITKGYVTDSIKTATRAFNMLTQSNLILLKVAIMQDTDYIT